MVIARVRKKSVIKIAKSSENLVFILTINQKLKPRKSTFPHFFIKETALTKKLSTTGYVENVENLLSKILDFSRFGLYQTKYSTSFQHSMLKTGSNRQSVQKTPFFRLFLLSSIKWRFFAFCINCSLCFDFSLSRVR